MGGNRDRLLTRRKTVWFCKMARNIAVTEEMVSAGVREYCKSDERFQSDEEIVTNIFIAMKQASRVRADNLTASNNIRESR